MIFGEIWFKWVLELPQIVFVVKLMVVMELLEVIPVAMEADLVVVQVVLVHLLFLELVNTPTSLETMEDQIMLEVDLNADVKLRMNAHQDLMEVSVKLDLMDLMVFLDFPEKMVKMLNPSINLLPQEPSTALLDLPVLPDHLVDPVSVECEDLKDLLASLEMMASLVLQASKDLPDLMALMVNLVPLEIKETMLRNLLAEKVLVDYLGHKEMKEKLANKAQLVLLVNLVRLVLLDLLDSKGLPDLTEKLDLRAEPAELEKTLNIVPAPAATVVLEVELVLMADVEAQMAEELVVMEEAELETMATMEAILVETLVAMLVATLVVLHIVVFVSKEKQPLNVTFCNFLLI